MKLSTKGRYGVRLMVDLASHHGAGPILLKDISRREEISGKYLWHLIHSLKSAGLITATRGVHGGYALASPPSEITIKAILQACEGSMCLVDCVEKPSACPRATFCIARDLWSSVTESINRIFISTTLADMVERQKQKMESLASDNYAI